MTIDEYFRLGWQSLEINHDGIAAVTPFDGPALLAEATTDAGTLTLKDDSTDVWEGITASSPLDVAATPIRVQQLSVESSEAATVWLLCKEL